MHTYDPGVQLFVHQFFRLCEVAECDFGGIFTLAHGPNHLLLLVMLDLSIDVNPGNFPM